MITSFYAGLLTFMYFGMSLETIKARRTAQVSLGYGKNDRVRSLVSAHSNFSSYVPLFLILFYLVEMGETIPSFVLHPIGMIFTIGRFFHFVAFRGEMNFKKRKRGMQMTLIPLMILGVMNMATFVDQSFFR